MPRNPFKEMAAGNLTEKTIWEEVGGAFSCQELGCWSTVGEAKYNKEKKILTWVCAKDHISTIEGFEL